LRINHQVRASRIRVIDPEGKQVGIVSLSDGLQLAEEHGLDLVEIAPTANPPVCKIINYGKYRYDQTKREKESKKAQHQIKIKEVKVKPNINDHDFDFKAKHAREFITKGNKVKVTCMFRGREMAHPEVGQNVVKRMCETLSDIAVAENNLKMLGRNLIVVLAPIPKKNK